MKILAVEEDSSMLGYLNWVVEEPYVCTGTTGAPKERRRSRMAVISIHSSHVAPHIRCTAPSQGDRKSVRTTMIASMKVTSAKSEDARE